MALRLESYVDLPEHRSEGGFDHAAVDRGRGRMFVAHTANDAVDVIDLAGSPDVVFLDPILRQLYVAIGDPGLIEVFDVERLERIDVVATERGAHTIGLDLDRHRVYAFLPATHRAAVFAAQS